MEHRCGHRLSLNIAVHVWGSDGPVHLARLSNVSLSGAFLQLAVPLQIMTAVFVELKWPTALSRGSVRLAGFVARQSPTGAGIEWDQFAPEGVVTLMREFLAEPGTKIAPVGATIHPTRSIPHGQASNPTSIPEVRPREDRVAGG